MSLGSHDKPDPVTKVSHTFDDICGEDGVYTPHDDLEKCKHKKNIKFGDKFPPHPETGQRTTWILIGK
jgi:hypothetical protein